MKKLIFALVSLTLLTGCSTNVRMMDNGSVITANELRAITERKEQDMYTTDEVKDAISDINALREEYKDDIDGRGFDSLYIDTYGGDSRRIKNVQFNNKDIYNDEYFDGLIDILDKSLARGIEDYLEDIKNKALEPEDILIEKIGRALVYTENRGENEDNYISIKLDLLDIKNEYLRELFKDISDGKYILDDIMRGEELNLLTFVNPNHAHNIYDYDALSIRYNMFLADNEIEKVNILLHGENGIDLGYDDIGVFINLINNLDLNKDEKDTLVEEYKHAFKEKSNSKNLTLKNYNLYVNYNKGDNAIGKEGKLIFFSIDSK